MPIFAAIRERLASRRERKRAAYAESRADGALEPDAARRKAFIEGRSVGTGTSPTGTPIDFTADEKPPKY